MMALLLLLSLAQETVYDNRDLGIRFTVPKDYTLRTKDFSLKWPGEVCEFSSPDKLIHGILVHFASAMKVERFADWREETWKELRRKEGEKEEGYRRLSEKKIDQPMGSWLLREHTIEYRSHEYRTIELYVAHGRNNFEIAIWVPVTMWDDSKDLLHRFVDSVRYDDPEPEEFTDPGPGPDVEVKGRRYIHRRRGFTLLAPRGWTIRAEKLQYGIQGGIVELQFGESAAAVLGSQDVGGVDAAAHAELFLEALKSAVTEYRLLEQTANRRDVRGVKDGVAIRYAILFAAENGTNYFVSVSTAEAEWESHKAAVDALFRSLRFFKPKRD